MVKDLLNKYLILKKTNVYSEELCNNIRRRLKLTDKELTNSQIKKTTDLSNKLRSLCMVMFIIH